MSILDNANLKSLFEYDVEYMGEVFPISNKMMSVISSDVPISAQYKDSYEFLVFISSLKEHYLDRVESLRVRYERLHDYTLMQVQAMSKAAVSEIVGAMSVHSTPHELYKKAEKTTTPVDIAKKAVKFVEYTPPINLGSNFVETETLSSLHSKLRSDTSVLRKLENTLELLNRREDKLRSLSSLEKATLVAGL